MIGGSFSEKQFLKHPYLSYMEYCKAVCLPRFALKSLSFISIDAEA